MTLLFQAFVTCSIGITNVGLVMIAFGCTNAFSTPVTSWIAKHTGRVPVVLSACLMHSAIIISLMNWTPYPDQKNILITIAAMWGIAEGIWMVQIHGMLHLHYVQYTVFTLLGHKQRVSNDNLQVELSYYFTYYFSTVVPSNCCVFLSSVHET